MTMLGYRLSLACLIGGALLGTACKGTRFEVFDKKENKALVGAVQQGRELLDQNENQKALDCFRRAVGLASRSKLGHHAAFKAQFVVYTLYFQRGMLEDSGAFVEQACRSALAYDAGHVSQAAQEYLWLFGDGEKERHELIVDILTPAARTSAGNDRFNVLGALFSTGLYNKGRESPEKAIKLFEHALKIASEIQKRVAPESRTEVVVAMTLINSELGHMYAKMDKHEQAAGHYGQAMAAYRQLDLKSNIVQLQAAGGRPLMQQLEEDLQKVQASVQRQVASSSRDVSAAMEKHYAAGAAQLRAKEYAQAAESLQHVIQAFETSGLAYHATLPPCHTMLGGALLLTNKDYQAAEGHFKQAIALAKLDEAGDYVTLESCITISQICLEGGWKDKVEDFVQMALPYATAYDSVNTACAAQEYLLRFPKDLADYPASMKDLLLPFLLNHAGSRQCNILGAHRYLGRLKMMEEDFEEAKKIFGNGRKIALAAQAIAADNGGERTDLQCFGAVINYQLGLAHHKLGAYAQAIEYYSQALAACEHLQANGRLAAFETFEIDYVKQKMEEAQEALKAQEALIQKYTQQAEGCSRADDHKGTIASCGKALAVCGTYGPTEHLDDVRDTLCTCLDISVRRFELKILALENRQKGDACMRERQYAVAHGYYRAAWDIYGQNFAAEQTTITQIRHEMVTAAKLAIGELKQLGQAAERVQNLKTALDLYTKALELQTEHFPEAASDALQLTEELKRVTGAMLAIARKKKEAYRIRTNSPA